MKFTQEIILRYIDGDLNKDESRKIKEELMQNKKLASAIKQQQLLHNTLLKNPLYSPSSGFSNRVMDAVYSSRIQEAGFFNKGRLFVVVLVSLAVLTTAYYFAVQFYPSLGSADGIEISLKNFSLDLQPIQNILSSTLIFKVVLYVNGFISLLLLDRAILKPYFARRKQRFSIQTGQ